MKIKISLASLNGRGAVADIIARGVFGGNLEIIGDHCATPAEVCSQAAAALREAADRFDLLAAEEKPLLSTTQRRINAAKMLREAAKRFDILARMPRPLQAMTQDDVNGIVL